MCGVQFRITIAVAALVLAAHACPHYICMHPLHCQTDDPKKTMMTRCTAEGVQRMLGISEGGQRALVAAAQLAGGDYDVQGAERVGEVLAVHAVRTLLKGAQVRRLLQGAYLSMTCSSTMCSSVPVRLAILLLQKLLLSHAGILVLIVVHQLLVC